MIKLEKLLICKVVLNEWVVMIMDSVILEAKKSFSKKNKMFFIN